MTQMGIIKWAGRARERAHRLDPMDPHRIAALHALYECERLYRDAWAALERARRELQGSRNNPGGGGN